MRKKIVAGNWKMNTDLLSACAIVKEIKPVQNVTVIVCPPVAFIDRINSIAPSDLIIGAQDVSSRENGAFTGEISSKMLASISVKYCLVGHSERRLYHNENSEVLINKLKRLLEQRITPIFCFGETLEQRKSGDYLDIVCAQLSDCFIGLRKDELDEIILAYEPVWAIGTGETATPEQAQEVHSGIRNFLNKNYDGIGNQISILYGGSCNATNADGLFCMEDIDGGLIGGASLKPQDFNSIILSAQ